MRSASMVVSGIAVLVGAGLGGCGGSSSLTPKVTACTRPQGADPGACLAVAEHHLARQAEDDARAYVERAIDALTTDRTCLRDHPARSCFQAVLILLKEPAEGLLAPYAVAPELAALAPMWTAGEATGPRAQARDALAAMCATAEGPPIERQRACLVLGDLVENERAKRCGEPCDPTSEAARAALGPWGDPALVDGYAAACKVDVAGVDASERLAFTGDVARLYGTDSGAAVCGVARSARRGASIAGTLDVKARSRSQAAQQAESRRVAAEREAQRQAALAAQQAAAERAAREQAALAARADLIAALDGGAWERAHVLLETHAGLGTAPDVVPALARTWAPFVTWLVDHMTEVGAHVELTTRLGALAPGHPLVGPLAELGARATKAVKKDARGARGLGARWLYAALLARIAGPNTPEARAAVAAHAALVAAARATLVIDKLDPACAPLRKEPAPPGRPIRATSTLACTFEPERRVPAPGAAAGSEATRRTFQVVAHGALAITRGAPRRTIPVDIEVVVDDADGSDPRTFELVRNAAVEQVWRSTIGVIEAEDAQAAHAAGVRALKAKRTGAALDQLVRHALIQGPSPELDQLLDGYGVAFQDLLAVTAAR